jgi:hypothetical protein
MRKHLRSLFAAAGLALSILAVGTWIAPIAIAQVIPGTATTNQRLPSPRYFPTQQVHYVRTTFAFNSCVQAANSCTVRVMNASLPYNAIVLRATMAVYTAFNSTTSDSISVGTTAANANEIVTAACSVAVVGVIGCTVLAAALNNTGNTVAQSGQRGGIDLFLKWTSGTGGTATTGLAAVILEYIAPNDGNCAPVPQNANPVGC